MPIFTVGAAGTSSSSYEIDNSLRLDGTEFLSKSLSSPNRQTFTFSTWFKIGEPVGDKADDSDFFSGGASATAAFLIRLNSAQQLHIGEYVSGWNYQLITDRLFRDSSAWYHVVAEVDTTQATASNRVKLYVNGVQETSFSTASYPSLNYNHTYINNGQTLAVGARGITSGSNQEPWGGYLAESIYIDGSALDQTSFGEFDSDSGIWKPINVSGLTFGTNGFYLDYESSSTLGNDANGGTDLSSTNLETTDQSIDTPTNNYATLNPIDNYYTPHSLSEGNLKQTTDSTSGYAPNVSTMALSQGKWYFEVKYVSRSDSDNYNLIGIKGSQITNTNYLGQNAYEYGYYSQSGKYYTSNSAVTYGDSYDQGDVIGCYLDLDNNKLYFAKNGSIQNSGTGISITAAASTPLGHYFFAVGDYGQSLTLVNEINFGSPISSLSSGNTDANGYGNFEYDPSSGTFDGASKDFYALNTKNLAEYG